MNIIDLFDKSEKENNSKLTTEEKLEKLNNFLNIMKESSFLSPSLIRDDHEKFCHNELELTLNLIEKLKYHAEFLKYILNFEQKNKISIVDAIVLVLKKEKIELHKNEIYEKIKMLNLSKHCVDKSTFTSTLGYLKKVDRIAHGKKRGYWKLCSIED